MIENEEFQEKIAEKLKYWKSLWNEHKYDVIDWWEYLVKPGIKEEAVLKTKELNKLNNGKLNMLFLRQIHYFQ